MSDKLRLLIARTGEVMEFDASAVPITRRGGMGVKVLPPGERFKQVIPDQIPLTDWDDVPEVAPPVKPQDDGPTTFWLCEECGLMVERAESEPLPESIDCQHKWIPLEV